MGYTHYFTHKECSKEAWDKILKDCRKLKTHLPKDVCIGNWTGKETPSKIFTKDKIVFNGVDRSESGGEDESHESFVLPRKSPNFEFCKTARKPYDLLVCGVMIVYDFYAHETADFGTDGTRESWDEALTFVARVLGNEYSTKFVLRNPNFF